MKNIKIAVMIVLLIGCSTACNKSRAVKGGGIGAAAGGALGGLIGHKAGNTVVGVLVGATIGGSAGHAIGKRMDKQAEELQKDLDGSTVQRVGEGILITFNEGLQFDVNSSDIRSESTENLMELSEVLKKYNDTDILIEGHTDSDGSDELNQNLSNARAAAVQTQLIEQGIPITRISTIGYGEKQPVADNDTAEGKQKNRRVEVAIYANKEMIKAAERGDLD